MQTFDIRFDPALATSALMRSLEGVHLQRGDHVCVSTLYKPSQAELYTLLLVIANSIAKGMDARKERDGARAKGEYLLKDLLSQYGNAEDLERGLEREYGVEITVVTRDTEDSDWLALSSKGAEAAYGENEPDYSNTEVREPNPYYRKHASE